MQAQIRKKRQILEQLQMKQKRSVLSQQETKLQEMLKSIQDKIDELHDEDEYAQAEDGHEGSGYSEGRGDSLHIYDEAFAERRLQIQAKWKNKT